MKLEIYRKMTQDLLILFITKANASLERYLVEHLNQVKGFKQALALAEQWEKSKVGLQTPMSIPGIKNRSVEEYESAEEEDLQIEAFGRRRPGRGKTRFRPRRGMRRPFRGEGRQRQRATSAGAQTKGKCFNCGKDGHFTRDCRSTPRNTKSMST